MLEEVAQTTKVLDDDHDFLTPEIRELCEALLPEPKCVKSADAAKVYIDLKDAVMEAFSLAVNSA